ncbi:MAG: ABC transporter permease [Bifidobacteriaceae bacterium]|jgi:oligopeptide transport system permease protein|nr:ABC transporter permease [Bifidobacteriaceae bacterium]
MTNTISAEHFVAPFNEDEDVITVDALDETAKSLGFWGEAWARLKRNPLFYIPTAFLIVLLVAVFFPSIFTAIDPTYCAITDSSLPVGAPGHLLGTTTQGCDVFSRLVYGAQPSLQIGIIVTLLGAFFGVIIGTVAGYMGGILDAILTRLIEIFISLPSMLSFIVFLQMMKGVPGVFKLIFIFSVFGWMSIARLMRANVMAAKNQEFVTSAKALGLSNFGRMFQHVLPNSIAPVIAVATMNVGAWIVLEASISYLGLGLGGNSASWGMDISNATNTMIVAPGMLFFPCLVLVLTSLTFILLGDALQDAIDPKARR